MRNQDMKKQLQFIAAFLDRNRENYLLGKGQGGKVDTAGYALFGLELGGWKSDATTEAVVEYLLLHNDDLDHSAVPDKAGCQGSGKSPSPYMSSNAASGRRSATWDASTPAAMASIRIRTIADARNTLADGQNTS